MSTLAEKTCSPCEGGIPALDATAAEALMAKLESRWTLSADARQISAQFAFRDYFRTMAFINAVAYVAAQEDHHPDISFGYNACTITWWTHAVDGLSENDFICAAKVDRLADGK
ncbi:pterin-4-alpha-carbinolamine dehydratase [Hydrocarboniphaga daqingensis]|uniref:Putative pterin-4-alpha-carbinolamine dehydratase n=1 Tax=Hydrocarboniphaga daqingensis TaxID=490188 RepID=A0A1M5KCM9_9GAMM|nr:4a-hydroxytetrahydrobiopterin dehydratase [Hydrocarboniphaga daqingensis]SHG50532.1 pterin-4-alpha-carbinolamine dehydratase [Hydrocarboniphaga daqingensis]